jgi:hypothetical protein
MDLGLVTCKQYFQSIYEVDWMQKEGSTVLNSFGNFKCHGRSLMEQYQEKALQL